MMTGLHIRYACCSSAVRQQMTDDRLQPQRLAHRVLGGVGPVLLILHANGFHGRAYAPLVNSLSEQYTCVSIDFPGQGDSPHAPGAPLDAETVANRVLLTVQQLGLTGRPHLMSARSVVWGEPAALLDLAARRRVLLLWPFHGWGRGIDAGIVRTQPLRGCVCIRARGTSCSS